MHAHNAEHREDAFAFETGKGFLVVAVSDGAGAYEWSRIGSAATAREITQRLQNWLSEECANLAKLDRGGLVNAIALQMVRTVHAITDWLLNELAPQSGAKPKDFRCTLLLTVWCRTERAEALLTTQVGDGFFGMLNRDGRADRHGEADSGAFSGEVTSFIPDTNAPEHSQKAIKSHPIAELEAILLCSDGVEDPFYPLDKNSAVIFHELYHSLPAATTNAAGVRHNSPIGSVLDQNGSDALATWLGFEKKGENDDRTIVLLHRDPPAPNIRIRAATPAA
jgi:serine/threonine protein phosphatase PrpC